MLANHLSFVLDHKSFIPTTNKIIKNINYFGKIDAIAGSGISGISIIPYICAKTNKVPIIVRKKDEKRHSKMDVEANIDNYDKKFNYIIIDDLISSGKTIDYIIDKISISYPNSKVKGIFLYDSPYGMPYIYEHHGYKINKKKIPTISLSEIEKDEY